MKRAWTHILAMAAMAWLAMPLSATAQTPALSL